MPTCSNLKQPNISISSSMGRPPTHGKSHTPTWNAWSGMRYRSTSRTASRGLYAKKNIKCCKRWESFEKFYADMGECPRGKSLERINRNGDYKPSNCKWATAREQALNRDSTVFYSLNGKRRCLTDWANSLGITRFALKERIRKWPIEKALTMPRGVFGPKARCAV